MTVIFDDKSKCCICKKEVKHKVLASTHSFGSPDLDNRPAEMQRSTMKHWVVKCPHCGYVDGKIDRKIGFFERRRIKKILASEEYQTCSGLDLPNVTAKKFYKKYLLKKDDGDNYELFSCLQNCAWACDDHGREYKKMAKYFRRKAIPYLKRDIAVSPKGQVKESKILKLADFYRRADRFEEVLELLEGVTFSEELYNQIAAYQIELAEKRDNTCHLISEATNDVVKTK